MTEPIACAGLRQSLLHDWQQDFPIAPSPFQSVARRVGGSVREVLAHCQALSQEGALHPLRPRWGEALQRLRWRAGLAGPPTREPPGLVCVDRLEPLDGQPLRWTHWAELQACDPVRGDAQLALLGGDGGPRLLLDDHCRGCTQACSGPCEDPELATACESGLPLVAEPYRGLAHQLDRSEREVLDRLRRWRRDGHLAGLGMAAPERPACSQHGVAWVGGPPPDAGQLRCLRAMPGIRDAWPVAGDAAWPWCAWVTADGPSAQVLLRRALAAAGLEGRPLRLFAAQRQTLRTQPLLFTPAVVSAPGTPPAA